jgi:lipoate-protein ligase A
MEWTVLDTGKASAEKNMSIDQELLKNIGESKKGIIHFYDWIEDSATYGYFTDPYQFLNEDKVNRRGLQLARRPTGGGIIFHLCDFAFSMLVPATSETYSINTLDNYHFINNIVARAIKAYGCEGDPQLLPIEVQPQDICSGHFCMAKPTIYDVMIAGKKVGGGAQRRTKQGFLHQGSLSLAMPSNVFLEDVLLPGTCVKDSMLKHSFLLLGSNYTFKQLESARKDLRRLLVEKSF